MTSISQATLAMQFAGEAKRNTAKVKARDASARFLTISVPKARYLFHLFIFVVLKPLRRREPSTSNPRLLTLRPSTSNPRPLTLDPRQLPKLDRICLESTGQNTSYSVLSVCFAHQAMLKSIAVNVHKPKGKILIFSKFM